MIAGVIAREAAGRGPRSNQLVSFVASDLRTSINYDYIDRVKLVLYIVDLLMITGCTCLLSKMLVSKENFLELFVLVIYYKVCVCSFFGRCFIIYNLLLRHC